MPRPPRRGPSRLAAAGSPGRTRPVPATASGCPPHSSPPSGERHARFRGDPPMLTLWGSRHRFCDGISRRSFLQIGAFGAGLSLAGMLRAREATGSPNKSAIMIYLPGGPSHLDMYDLKPDAPKEYRGEFRPIATNVPGVQI